MVYNQYLGTTIDNLNIVIVNDAKAATSIGDVISSVADYAGVIGAAINVIEFLDHLAAPSDNTLAEMLQVLQSIETSLKSQALLAKLRDLEASLQPAEAVFATLKETLNASPPVDSAEIVRQIQVCFTALVSLEPEVTGEADVKWRVGPQDQDYFPWPGPGTGYAYAGNGISSAVFPVTPQSAPMVYSFKGLNFANQFLPPIDPDGLVFSHTFVKSLYLRALMIFLTVGAVLDPKHFLENNAGNIRNAADFLLKKHDKILKEGIVNLLAPTRDDVSRLLVCPGCGDGSFQETAVAYVCTPWDAATIPPVDFLTVMYPYLLPEFRQPFGAVDLFSGGSSVGSYQRLIPPVTIPFDALVGGFPTPSEQWFLGFFGKYLLRTLKHTKDVYRSIGLPALWRCVNRLRALVGDSPLVGTSFDAWSLREILDVAGGRGNPWLGGPSLQQLGPGVPQSVRFVIFFLTYSPPQVPHITVQNPKPTSLRALLDGFDTYVVGE